MGQPFSGVNPYIVKISCLPIDANNQFRPFPLSMTGIVSVNLANYVGSLRLSERSRKFGENIGLLYLVVRRHGD